MDGETGEMESAKKQNREKAATDCKKSDEAASPEI
jgi:hypothetical protein